jgi:DNA repair exonuclease SbcCD ATPase subunit
VARNHLEEFHSTFLIFSQTMQDKPENVHQEESSICFPTGCLISSTLKNHGEKIQQEIKQLVQKQVDLEKAHQQRVKSYKERVQAFDNKVKDYERQKSLHQRLFGQPPLHPDPELSVDPELQAVKNEIEDLKEQRGRLYDILLSSG